MTKGFAQLKAEEKPRKTQTAIMRHANALAKANDYAGKIAPVEEWMRAHTNEPVAGFNLVSIGVLTTPEKCVIHALRSVYTTAFNMRKVSTYLVYQKIATRLEIETVGEVSEILNNQDLRNELMTKYEVTAEEAAEWRNGLEDVIARYNLKLILSEMMEHIIAFVMAMRCNPKWDYEHNNQLDDAQREAIIKFLNSEEGLVFDDEDPDTSKDVKKP